MAAKRSDIGIDPENKTAQRQMWDGWWYDRFEIPNTIPAESRRIAADTGNWQCDPQGKSACVG